MRRPVRVKRFLEVFCSFLVSIRCSYLISVLSPICSMGVGLRT